MLIAAVVGVSLAPPVLYASPKGNDAWQGTEARPFRTLHRLQEQVLRMRASGDLQPLTVKLSGKFVLSDTWQLGPEFRETTIDGQGKTVLDGGTELRTWNQVQLDDKVAWAAPVNTGYIRQFFVGGARRPRATLPKTGFFEVASLLNGAAQGPYNEGQDEAKLVATDLGPLANMGDVEFVANHYWIQSRMRLADVDRVTHVAKFDRKSVFRLTDDNTGRGAPYRFENVFEGLSNPGDWYLDVPNSRVLYLPKPGERRGAFVGSVCRLPVLVHARNLQGLVIRGVAFEHAEWQPPANSAGDVQAATSVPAAVKLTDAKKCVIKDCVVRECGTYGIAVLGASEGNVIKGCEITDMGGGGVKVDHGTVHTTISDCRMEHLGRIFASAIGVWIGDSGGNIVTHNLIRDLYYTGVSVGWVWGYGPSRGTGNVIEYNEILDVGQGQLSDMGAIYTLGTSPGTVITHNRIRNVDARGYGGWGIYLDEGSTGIIVSENLVENVKTGGFHQHYGQDNIIRNNVFMNARTAGQLIRTRAEDHKSFTIEQNVVVWAGTDLLGSNWEGDGFDLDKNVYWRTDGTPITFAGKTLSAWQALGHDRESIVADPRMTIGAYGVRFKKGSPATALGIESIDLSGVGPRK